MKRAARHWPRCGRGARIKAAADLKKAELCGLTGKAGPITLTGLGLQHSDGLCEVFLSDHVALEQGVDRRCQLLRDHSAPPGFGGVGGDERQAPKEAAEMNSGGLVVRRRRGL